jgi:hypothetical protein
VKAELEKLISTNFIRPLAYASWISNIVPISKKNGSIRIYINFQDLHKACPKDDFPLPNIKTIVDLTVGHSMFSLMDGFSRHNQIIIAPEDQEKKIFTCAWGTFCWNVMPFGLKNTGATYQRAMITILHDMMHIFMEDYVDDILAKFHSWEEHLPKLAKIFTRLEAFKVRLNPKKCTFGIKSSNLLGYIVLAEGIEVDPEKVQAIISMQPSKNLN